MKYIKDIKYNLLLILLLSSLLGFSQSKPDTDGLKPFQLKNSAKHAIRIGDVFSAITYLEEYCKIYPTNDKMNYSLAEMYDKTRNYDKARELYKKVYNSNPKKYPIALYNMACMEKCLGKYGVASDSYIRFLTDYKGAKDFSYYKKVTQLQIEGCEKSDELLSNDDLIVDINVLPNSVNSPHVDLSPLQISETEMIYGSLGEKEINYYEISDTVSIPKMKLYKAMYVNNEWVKKGEFLDNINSNDINTGNLAFSVDGNRMYFSRCEKNNKNVMECSLWVSFKKGNSWGNPKMLNPQINLPNFTSTMPTCGIESKKNHEVVYFVSNRPGGKGGNDIWFFLYDIEKDKYKKPRNASSKINTKGDEITPFYNLESKSLYFSSSLWPGLGGQDIFQTTGELNKWLPPKNIGGPINSSNDDIYYTYYGNKDKGFFVSNRTSDNSIYHETCCYDIYSFNITNYLHLGIKGQVFDNGSDIESDSIVYPDNAVVKLYLYNGDNKVFVNSDSIIGDDTFFFKLEENNDYKLEVEADGYFDFIEDISTHDATKSDTSSLDVFIEKSAEEAISISNIYFEYGKSLLSDSSKLYLKDYLYKLLVSNPEIIVEISAHTDNKGTEEYNLKLSQERAESIVTYLIESGIDRNRLVAKGYGELKPIFPNENPDGSDNPEGREKNRRTEFKVIGEVKTNTKKRTDEE